MVKSRHENKEPYLRLAEINRAITTSLDFDRVLKLIVENAAQLVDADASLLLLTDQSNNLRIRAGTGVDEKLISSFSGRMEEDVIKVLGEALALPSGAALVSVPIIAKNILNGLLVIAREDELDAEEEWQLSALADQAAIALRNARLYEMELAEANRERDKTLEALSASNARTTHILESITDLFYQVDDEWRFIDVNRQAENRLGMKRADLIGKVIWDVFPTALNSLVYPMFHQVAEEREPRHFELPSSMVPGTWFEAHVYPSDPGIAVYLRDISERKRADVTSRLLSSIVASSDDAIVSKDLNGIINSWNQGAQRIFGYSAEEAIGKSIYLLIPDDRADEELAIMARIASGQAVQHFETVRRRKDGQMIDISLTVSPVKDESGVIVGASKIARDITEHKKALEEIRFQASLLSAVEQAVIATTLEGVVISWNSFAEQLYGWSAEEALGRNIVDLTPALNAKDQAETIFAKLRKGESWSGEMLLRRRNGTEFPAMVTDSPISDEKGDLVGVVGVSVDITDSKRVEQERSRLLERERVAREEAETANRTKDEFLATLSHELRNPLNVVIGYAEILRRSSDSTNQSFVSVAAEAIRRNALAQSQLVSDLLDLSRLQMRKLALNRQPVSLTTIIEDAIETVKVEAAAKNISLQLDNRHETLVVQGDSVRLGQIVWNVLNNAVKFTPSGGKITISLDKIGSEARLIIQDTGQGISPEFLPHVFEIFRQADSSSSRKQGGLGIGLALVKQLAELHDGRVEADSAGTGRGTKFSIWLPIHDVAPGDVMSVTSGHSGVLNEKVILVVDDSHETTDMLSKLLQMEGASVRTARSGEEALKLAKDKEFDLVISDISMPEMDGYQLLQKLRAFPSMNDVPKLALTGFGRSSDIDRARKEGFAAHFTKPLDIDKLLETVKRLTSTHHPKH